MMPLNHFKKIRQGGVVILKVAHIHVGLGRNQETANFIIRMTVPNRGQ